MVKSLAECLDRGRISRKSASQTLSERIGRAIESVSRAGSTDCARHVTTALRMQIQLTVLVGLRTQRQSDVLSSTKTPEVEPTVLVEPARHAIGCLFA